MVVVLLEEGPISRMFDVLGLGGVRGHSALRVGLVNVNSVLNKICFLSNFASEQFLDFVVVTETWLTPDVQSSFVAVAGYDIVRADSRTGIRKHGVCIYVKNGIRFVQSDLDIGNAVAVHLLSYDIWVLGVYRPPSYSNDQNNVLMDIIAGFSIGREVILLGDFNLPSLKWQQDDVVGYISPVDRAFLECFVAEGLTQWVLEPTFVPSGNILDLIFTSEGDRVGSVEVMPPFPRCAHSPVICDYVFRDGPFEDQLVDEPRRLWFRGSYRAISNSLSDVDWDFEFAYGSADENYSRFVFILLLLVDEFIPLQVGIAGCPWSVRPPRRLMTCQSKAWLDYKHCRAAYGRRDQRSVDALGRFLDINYQLRNYVNFQRADYEMHLVERLPDCPKLFHSYIRKKKKGCLSVGPLRLDDGELMDNPEGMSEVFADAFSSVYVRGAPEDPTPDPASLCRMNDFVVTVADVYERLLSLDDSSAMGPDGIHPKLLKECAGELAYPLQLIFDKSLQTSCVPVAWLESCVIPLFKAKSRYVSLNYRPVSLTSVCCKTMERVVVAKLVEYLDGNQLLFDGQFGFRRGRSTDDQLLLTYGDVATWVDSGLVVDVAFLDFSKAFDVVCHTVLLSKLDSLGVCGHLLDWIGAFLSDRVMRVCVDGHLSGEREVISGVPQGSVLGPVLFLAYVNSLVQGLSCSVMAFADDFKVYVSYRRSPSDCFLDGVTELQRDLSRIHAVATSWNLRLNPEKCVVMRFCRGFVERELDLIPYYLGGSQLLFVDSHRDLGVLVDNKLKFHLHVRQIVGKAAGLASSLLRSTVCRNPHFMVTLFVSHIRPILDYCSTVWNVGYVGDLKLLESVQRRWTKQVEGLGDLEYGERLRQLQLFSIKGRLLRSDLVKCWKVVCGDGVAADLSVLFDRAPDRRTRGHPYKLLSPRSRTDMRSRFFSSRCVRVWNGLPVGVVSARSLGAFKRCLVECLGDVMFDYA